MEAIESHLRRLDDLRRQLKADDPSGNRPEIQVLQEQIRKTLARWWPSIEAGTVVLVEPRKHRALEFVIRNVLESLEDGIWKLQLCHGIQNENWVRRILERPSLQPFRHRIELRNLGVENLASPAEYSRIVASRKFTEGIPTETFLMVQTDSMICPQWRHLLYKFLPYDYVGAPWPWEHLKVGNGGFSLRKKSKMLEIIDAHPPFTGLYEDHFFSAHARFKPSPEEAREFSIEQVYHPRSFGVHKVWAHQPAERLPALIYQCDGLQTLIDLQTLDDDTSS